MLTELVDCGDLKLGDRIYICGHIFTIESDPIHTQAPEINIYGDKIVRFFAVHVGGIGGNLPETYARGIYGARNLVKYCRII